MLSFKRNILAFIQFEKNLKKKKKEEIVMIIENLLKVPEWS